MAQTLRYTSNITGFLVHKKKYRNNCYSRKTRKLMPVLYLIHLSGYGGQQAVGAKKA